MATKSSPFQINYERESRMGFDIRKKEKNEKAKEFAREMKERHEKVRAVLVKSQEEMKRQVDRSRKEVEEYRVEDKVLVKIIDGGLHFLFFLFLFYFTLLLLFLLFSIFRTTQIRIYQLCLSHQSQVDGVVTRLITRLRRRK